LHHKQKKGKKYKNINKRNEKKEDIYLLEKQFIRFSTLDDSQPTRRNGGGVI